MANPYSDAKGTTATAAPPTELGSLYARLNEACKELDSRNDRFRRIGDALHGVRPEPDGMKPPSAVPNGVLQEINETVDRLFALLGETDRHADRLSNLA